MDTSDEPSLGRVDLELFQDKDDGLEPRRGNMDVGQLLDHSMRCLSPGPVGQCVRCTTGVGQLLDHSMRRLSPCEYGPVGQSVRCTAGVVVVQGSTTRWVKLLANAVREHTVGPTGHSMGAGDCSCR